MFYGPAGIAGFSHIHTSSLPQYLNQHPKRLLLLAVRVAWAAWAFTSAGT